MDRREQLLVSLHGRRVYTRFLVVLCIETTVILTAYVLIDSSAHALACRTLRAAFVYIAHQDIIVQAFIVAGIASHATLEMCFAVRPWIWGRRRRMSDYQHAFVSNHIEGNLEQRPPFSRSAPTTTKYHHNREWPLHSLQTFSRSAPVMRHTAPSIQRVRSDTSFRLSPTFSRSSPVVRNTAPPSPVVRNTALSIRRVKSDTNTLRLFHSWPYFSRSAPVVRNATPPIQRVRSDTSFRSSPAFSHSAPVMRNATPPIHRVRSDASFHSSSAFSHSAPVMRNATPPIQRVRSDASFHSSSAFSHSAPVMRNATPQTRRLRSDTDARRMLED